MGVQPDGSGRKETTRGGPRAPAGGQAGSFPSVSSGGLGQERLQVAVAPPGRWTHLSGESGSAWASELPFRAHSRQSGGDDAHVCSQLLVN